MPLHLPVDRRVRRGLTVALAASLAVACGRGNSDEAARARREKAILDQQIPGLRELVELAEKGTLFAPDWLAIGIDEKLVQDLIARRPDIRLLTARDGNRGIEIARASLPDVILMDINLPGISGIQALKVLAQDVVTARIPVVALSANAVPRDIARGMEAGFFRYLTKPIKVNEFMETLDVALKFAEAQAVRASDEG